MTSTALDAALCLLLVSAGAVTVATQAGPATDRSAADRADGVAETLAASTATVNYTLAPGLPDRPTGSKAAGGAGTSARARVSTSNPELLRTTHGTLAGLLAEAAVSRVAVDGTRLTRAGDDFARRTGRRVASAAGTNRSGVQVIAVWRPYPGAHVGGRTVVGESPPETASVRAATLAAPSGVPSARREARAAAPDGFDAVAAVVAERLVAGLVPARQARLALHGDHPDATLMYARYARLSDLYGENVSAAVDRGDAGRANTLLADAVAERVEGDLRRAFDSPAAAARALELDRVRIVVRTWS